MARSVLQFCVVAVDLGEMFGLAVTCERFEASKTQTVPAAHQPSEWDQLAFFCFFGLHWSSPESGDLWYKSGGSKETIWWCLQPTSPQNGHKSPVSSPVICTGGRRNSATVHSRGRGKEDWRPRRWLVAQRERRGAAFTRRWHQFGGTAKMVSALRHSMR